LSIHVNVASDWDLVKRCMPAAQSYSRQSAVVGDVIHIRGHTTDFSQTVESLEVNHAPATEVGPNDDFGLKVVQHAREHDVVYKVRP
jgi:hypothetical protein